MGVYMNSNQIILTKNDIPSIIHSRFADHSDLAARFIEKVKSEVGIDSIACYFETSEFLSDIKTKKFTDMAILTLYARFKTEEEAQNAARSASERIYSIFADILSADSISLTYTRLFTPDEMELYGFNGVDRDKWDRSKIIDPSEAPEEKHTVIINSFDSLVRWHMLAETAPKMKKSISETFGLPIEIYCGWDERLRSMNHYIAFKDRKTYGFYADKINSAKAKMVELIMRYDKWSAVDNSVYQPEVMIWNELDPEKRFAFLHQ